MKRVSIILALLMLAGVSLASADSELYRDIGVELIKTSPSVVADETEFTAFLVFTNAGDSPRTISFYVESSSLFSHTGPGSLEYKDILIGSGESIDYQIQIYAKDLVLARNPLKIVIGQGSARATKTVFVTGTLEQKYIDLSISDFEAIGDDRVSLDLHLTPSEEFYNVKLDFGLSDLPMQISGDDNIKIIPYLSEPMTIPMEIALDDRAESRIYQVPVVTSANDAYNNPYESIAYMPVNLRFPDRISIGSITSTPQTLRRGTMNNIISVEIANMGKDEVENLDARLSIRGEGFDPTFFGSNREFVGAIGAKERKEAQFKFDIDDSVPSGSRKADLALSYDHLGRRVEKTFEIDIAVQKLPYFVFNQTTNLRDPENRISFFVTNTGDECTDVEVTGLTSNLPISWKRGTDKAAKLDEGETKEFKLQLEFNELALDKEYGVPVRIRCVHNEEPLIQEEEVFVLSTGREDNLLPLAIAGLFLLAIAALLGRHVLRPQKSGDGQGDDA